MDLPSVPLADNFARSFWFWRPARYMLTLIPMRVVVFTLIATFSLWQAPAWASPPTSAGFASEFSLDADNKPKSQAIRSRRARRVKSRSSHARKSKVTKAVRSRRGRYVQLQSGPGINVRNPRRSWGTRLAVRLLKEMGESYARAFPTAAPIWIHDLSRRRGGTLRPHKSHRRGKDVDIRVVLNYDTKFYRRASAKTLHLERTWFQIKTLLKSRAVQYIFLDYRLQKVLYGYAKKKGVSDERLKELFQYPRGRRSNNGIIRYEPGHANHLHIRFFDVPQGPRSMAQLTSPTPAAKSVIWL